MKKAKKKFFSRVDKLLRVYGDVTGSERQEAHSYKQKKRKSNY